MIEKVVPHLSALGESPVWDEVTQTIIWVDIVNGEIHSYSTLLQKHRVNKIGIMVGSVALCATGHWILATEKGFVLLKKNEHEIKWLADPEAQLKENRFNDGKCDVAGRFWAGTMNRNGREKQGNLYMLNADLSVEIKIANVSVSNGLAWSIDHSILYYIDTPTAQVVAFDFDSPTGGLAHKRTILQIPSSMGRPDGMTIDSEGMLWIALWGSGKITRWDPLNGRLLHCFQLPVANVTSCTFGGNHLNDLYITSASVGLSEHDLKDQPLAGSLFVIKNCGFKGMPAARFNDQHLIARF